jgi:chemotaxis protein methyltransferase CheR
MTVAEAPVRPGADDPELPARPVLQALGAACGLDLESFRAPHVARTIDRAVARQGAAGPSALAEALVGDRALRARFRRAVAVSTTGMFRDPEQFRLLDGLLREQARDRPLRVWSIGASDGSELCSIALLLERQGRHERAVLLGSDLLPENVALAREGGREHLTADLLGLVRFEERDVARSAPAGTWDVVLCRNVLIHLSAEPRRRMLDHAAAALSPGGLLLLGRSERLPRDGRRGLQDAGANAYRRSA